MNILELIQKTTVFFEKAGVPNPRLDVELLLAGVLGLKRMDLYLQFERTLSEVELDHLRPLVRRRAAREPLQHLVGTVEFHQLTLRCGPQALIPRQETELLVEKAVRLLSGRADAAVLDVGTGTGAIILCLAQSLPGAKCVAVDISAEALMLARQNAGDAGLLERVDFRQGSLFEPLKEGERFDLIVSNPPYIRTDELDRLQPEVKHDPRLALDGGADGLDVIRPLISDARKWLATSGWLALEMGCGQGASVAALLKEGGCREISIEPDLAGCDRIAVARAPE
ncbi:MAG: peptide chain release factor N(5)-glutamine methyltransferase [Verrucomicrobiae bacterium]|nr:peptide chain release factor N(5)-glutamine methyltransferase [Verrucomicrobiae bacterium]